MKNYLRCKSPSGTDTAWLAPDTPSSPPAGLPCKGVFLMAMGSSTQNVVPPLLQGIKSGKHQANGQEEQKEEEGDAQGPRRALKWAQGLGC